MIVAGNTSPHSSPSLNLQTQSEPLPKGLIRRLLLSGRPADQAENEEKVYPWYVVLWLTGVDYFSSLGYQPGIALLAAGALSVPATAALVLVTLLAAVPVYSQVARRSYAGQGSIALLEHLLPGWTGKIFILILLGFTGTDFVITMTLSAADAARHAIANPYLQRYVGDAPVLLTLALLLLLAVVFLLGFQEAIGVARIVALPYLVLNLVVLLGGLWEIARHPALLHHWRFDLSVHGDWTAIFVASALIFPQLALGLSGFETGVSVMPLVAGQEADTASPPWGRIRATKKLLVTAAVIMSCMLLLSSFVATLLIPEADYRLGGPASGRALAYLAHRLLGNNFGAVYDLSTILILWFAGASAMTGLLNLIPRYLPRFGMAPRWVAYRRPLVLVLLAINVAVTLAFRAQVEAQAGAYATGVLVLMFSGAVGVALDLWRESSLHQPQTILVALYFWVITFVFAYTLGANIVERPDGLIVATIFIILLLATSAISRYARSTEMRVSKANFVDQPSAELWNTIAGKKVNLISDPISTPDRRDLITEKVRRHFKIEGPLAFIHVNLLDNRSEFAARLRVQVRQETNHYVIEVGGAVAVANTIAYLSELLDPVSIVLGLTHRNLMKQSLAYLIWGEGETGLMCYSILVRRWEFAKPMLGRPLIFLISE
jgi:hypothetical protein